VAAVGDIPLAFFRLLEERLEVVVLAKGPTFEPWCVPRRKCPSRSGVPAMNGVQGYVVFCFPTGSWYKTVW